MSFLFLLVSSILFTFMFVFWKTWFQRNTGEMSSNSTSLALVRSSFSTQSTKSITDKSLSVNTMQKRILVNLRIVEYKLAELEQFLVTKGLNGALVNRKSTDKPTECNNN
ncbi:hypothetical protein FD755_016275 [Muntiacus reevesi]|uniref:Kita-kyushu lung cancer antigen 1 n=1 Tax=Muntiacus reevesi TaxID=9886 RepID=A0A5N3XFJ2_MUNRE|nr:hypothetical protein FD755_016275 [Muntiacus reevesi]